MSPLPPIGITCGDPAGIGPEIAAKALADPRVLAVCRPAYYAPRDVGRFVPGQLSADAGRAAVDAIVQAVADARAGRIAAVVTCPINKEALALAGMPWRGHTDLLAHLTESEFVAMMFYSPRLVVVLATVHVALSEVPRLLTRERLERVVALAARELPRFGVARPRLAVAGLNPHAGEHGVMGDEDDRVLRPAIEALSARGLDVRGPFPADTLFVRAMKGEFDAVVACYHDQGLIPIKMAAFGSAVNVTLGLPIIRTSVDHGTAFEIAGKGIADHGSLVEAVLLAAKLAANEGLGLRAEG
ncbi:MAG: 4-hydroxythreonine-4-phosphate dehydrogenase PdxA [Bacteroidales bacterium]